MNFDTLFNPRSVAVIGASPQSDKVGYSLVYNLLQGAQRKVYPINRKFSDVLGLPCLPSVSAIDDTVDLAIIAIGANYVADALRECGQKGIKTVIVITAGFKEVGAEGKALEEEIKRVADEFQITLLGPNCLGVLNATDDFNASFTAQKAFAGHVAFVSQSGAIGTSLLDWAHQAGIGFSKFISLGNEAALNEIDFLEYLAQDENTRAILMYLEHVSDGRRFMELAHAITPRKPIVILRAGRGKRGSSAVMSHTGSLAPEDAIFSAACKQCGIITVDSLRDLFSFAKLFQIGVAKPLTRLVVLTNGGGPSVNAADLTDFSCSLELTEFSEKTKNDLRKVLPSMAAVGNPVDIIGDATSKRYDDTLKILCAQKDVDAIMVIVTPQMMTDAESIARVVVSHFPLKPIIPVFMGGRSVSAGIRILHEHKLVSFGIPSDVIRVLDALALGKKKTQTVDTHAHLASSLEMLSIEKTMSLLREYGLPLSGIFVRSKEDLEATLRELSGDAFAMKAVSHDVVHKTEARAVRLGLHGIDKIKEAWDDIVASVTYAIPGAAIDGMLLQKMVDGKEVIIGMKRDPVFGPVIVFGLGGIFVEVLKSVSMKVAPITKEEALAQIHNINGSALLYGVRGEKPVNIDSLADIIVALSRLALQHPEIAEIDLNPVIATENSAVVVDARFMIRKDQ